LNRHAQANLGRALSSVPIAEVWERLGGGEIRNGRGRAFHRDGDGFNVALDLERELWFDHAAGVGGGIVALVQTARNCDRRAALAWLHAEGFLEDRPFSPEERRAYSRCRVAASVVARDVEHWRAALAEELNARKLKAAEDSGLEAVPPLCFVLECGPPEAVAREFFRYRRANPDEAAVLIKAGRARWEESQRLAAVLVVVLARVAGSEAPHAA
jgi:hypothetical protein